MKFDCTNEVRRSRGSRWRTTPLEHLPELEVRGHIRALKPPAGANQMIIVGEDDQGIVAVAFTETVDGPHDVFVKVLAVELRARGQGHVVADALMEEVISRHINRLMASSSEHRRIEITGKVDHDNLASQAMCRRFAAEVSPAPRGERYDEWLITVERPAVEA